MNQPILSKSDINSLYQILEEANKAYLKESRHNDKPGFNILRVLAAFRLLYHQSPPALYNAILFVTKNYDPQTYYHWKKAIEELNRNRSTLFKSKSNYCRPEITTYTKTYQNSFNRSRINETEHFQSKSYAQINIPQQINHSKEESFEDDDAKDVSQTNVETGKRQYYTKADTISHVSKNHYISFEPYRHSIDHYRNQYFDKENINSTNVEESRKKESAYQYIEAIQRDLNRTKNSQIKTPIDQSFIKNINCSESPFLYSKMPQQIIDPIEEQMNARANTFYHFNLKLKVFSSLQANSYVFLKAKENQMKAKLQYHSKLLQNSFISFNRYSKISKEDRKKQSKADQFNAKILCRKVFNILKLVFELRKKADTQKVPSAIEYNKSSFEFILNLLFSLNQSGEDEKMDFDNKIIQLIHSDQANKLYLIVKYFGKHAWISEENIQNLTNLYRQRICRQAFNSIHQEQEKNMKYYQIRNSNLKKQSFYALKLRWNRFACYKQKINCADAKRNRTLLEKVMKSMLQTVYSTKLYSKRCQYIERKHLFQLKTKTYKMWMERTKIQQENKQKLTSQTERVIEKIILFIKKIAMKKIKEQMREVEDNIKIVIKNNIAMRKIEFFKCLKINITNAQKIKESERMMEKLKCAMAISKWKENTRKGKAIASIANIIKSYYFRKLVLPNFQESLEIFKDIQLNQLDIQRRTFKEMKRLIHEERRKRQNLTSTLKDKIKFIMKSISITRLYDHLQLQKERRERELIIQKAQQLRKFRNLVKFQKVLENLKQYANQSQQKKCVQTRLINALHRSYSKQLLSKLRQMKYMKENQLRLREELFLRKADLVSRQFLNVICLSKSEKIRQLRKRNCSHAFALALESIYANQNRQIQLSDQFRNKQLSKKVIEGLRILQLQSAQVLKIARRINSKKNWDVVKDSLFYSRNIIKVQKLHHKNQIKSVFYILSKQKRVVINQNGLADWKRKRIQNDFINCLALAQQEKRVHSEISQKVARFRKWQGIARLNHQFIRKLISNKHLYMALKFRALKLCLNSFAALASKRPRRKPTNITHKGLAERLSTDIAQ